MNQWCTESGEAVDERFISENMVDTKAFHGLSAKSILTIAMLRRHTS